MRYSESVIFFVLIVCGVANVFCDPPSRGSNNNRYRRSKTNSGAISDLDSRGYDAGVGAPGGKGGSGGEQYSEEEEGECDDKCGLSPNSEEEHDESDFDDASETESIAMTNRLNKKVINRALIRGINQVCKIELDNPVLAACGEGEIDKIEITLSGVEANRTTFPLCQMNYLETYKDVLMEKNVTYIVVTGWPVSNHLNPVDEFYSIGVCRPEATAIILNLGRNLPMVYNTLNNNSEMCAYLIFRFIKYLCSIGLAKRNLVFVGASIGAQVLAMGMTLLNKDCKQGNEKFEKFIGLDPTLLCKGANYITEDIANQVVVMHGDSERYGVKKPLGTIDIYPNGCVGYQPGCDSCQCSHVRPMQLFVEAVCNPNSLMVVKCRSWKEFMKGRCGRGETFDMMQMPVYCRGTYFMRTGKHPNYALGHKGVVPYKEVCFD